MFQHKKGLSLTLTGIIVLLAVTFISTGCNFFGYPEADEVSGLDIRTVRGTSRADGSLIKSSLKASTTTTTNIVIAAGVKVYCPCSPEIFVITDSEGKFSLSVNMAVFRAWLLSNKIPEFADSGVYGSDENVVPIIAEKIIQNADGTTTTLSAIIPVPFGNNIVLDLDSAINSAENPSSWLKVNSTLNGTCKENGQPVSDLKVLFYEGKGNQYVKQFITDAAGVFSASIAPGIYRIVLLKDGFEPFVRNGVLLNEGETHNIQFDYTGVPASNDGTDINNPITAPNRNSPPAFKVAINNENIAAGQTVTFLQGTDLNFKIEAYDVDSGLGEMSGTYAYESLFTTITDNKKAILSTTVAKNFSKQGSYQVKLNVKDFDQLTTIKPASAGYLQVSIPTAGSAWFANSIGIKVVGADGQVKYNDIIIEDANAVQKKTLAIKVEPTDRVTPFIRVDTKTHITEGVPNKYDLLAGDLDEINKMPVCEAEISDNKVYLAFEDCKSADPWCDFDYGDVKFVVWFTQLQAENSQIVTALTDSTNSVDFQFNVKVTPVITSSGKISGKVIDDDTDKPVVGAIVGIAGTDLTTFTDNEGFFEIVNVPAGTYDLVATRDGYQGKTFSGIVVP